MCQGHLQIFPAHFWELSETANVSAREDCSRIEFLHVLHLAYKVQYLASLQVAVKFYPDAADFAAERAFYASQGAISLPSARLRSSSTVPMSAPGTAVAASKAKDQGSYLPRIHEVVVEGGNALWSGSSHPPAVVMERGHFSLKVGRDDTEINMRGSACGRRFNRHAIYCRQAAVASWKSEQP